MSEHKTKKKRGRGRPTKGNQKIQAYVSPAHRRKLEDYCRVTGDRIGEALEEAIALLPFPPPRKKTRATGGSQAS